MSSGRNTHTYTYTHNIYKVDFVLEKEHAGFSPFVIFYLINNNNK